MNSEDILNAVNVGRYERILPTLTIGFGAGWCRGREEEGNLYRSGCNTYWGNGVGVSQKSW